VEKAQLEAERALTKVNERLEKRAEALSRAEARALAGSSPKVKQALAHPSDGNGTGGPASADEAAELVAELQVEHASAEPEPRLVLPEGS
jgi:hypothetical protein